MAFTNNLKSVVDQPVFEWMRFLPVTTAATSCIVSDNTRYGYYFITNALYRYDTWSDTWQQLATAPSTPTAASYVSNLAYNPYHGYYGRAISCPSNATLQIAGLNGQALKGAEIHILAGTGAGQTRTITAVAEPTVHDFGIVTTFAAGPPAVITDATSSWRNYKYWKPNQWRDYQVRVTYSTGVNQVRKILYNSTNTISINDYNVGTYNVWYSAPWATSPVANTSLYQIESSVITVNTAWDVNPDNTSQFVIKTGGLWQISGSTAAPWYLIQYYDIVADVWYNKGSQQNLIPATINGADVAIECVNRLSGTLTSNTGAISVGSSPFNTRTLIDAGKSMAINQYANMMIDITGGTGKGQRRTILANNATTFFISKPWDTAPSSDTTYNIISDSNKLYFMGGAYSSLFQYNLENDIATVARQHNWGVARTFSASFSGQPAIGLTTITRSTGGIATVAVNAAGTGYHVDDVLTCTTTGTGGLVRVTSITDTTGAVTGVSLLNPGSGYSAGSTATTVLPAGGSSCTITITVTDIAVATTGTTPHNFVIGDTVTIAGAAEAGYNGAKTVLGSGFLANGTASNVTFIYATTGLGGNATASSTQSTTVLVDAAANWQVDELIGKLIQVSSAGPNQVATMRRISDNTATTITWVLALGGAATSATTTYTIYDVKALGTEAIERTTAAKQAWGFASSGSNTTLVDSSKAWCVNEWQNRKVKIICGTGFNTTGGNEFVVTSNSATTLTVSAFGFTPDTTTGYEILDCYGLCTGGSATTLVDSTQNFPNNGTYSVLTGKRVKITAGANAGTEYTVTGATNTTTLTYASGITTTTDNTYAILGVNTRSTGICLFRTADTTDSNLKSKYLYSFRGGATPTVDRFDMTKNYWDIITQYPLTETYTTGTIYTYNNKDRIYFTKDATGRLYYYDIVKNIIVPCGTVPYGMGTGMLGSRMFVMSTTDLDAANLEFVYLARHSGTEFWRTLVFF